MQTTPDSPIESASRPLAAIGIILLAWCLATGPSLLLSPIERASKARAVAVARNMVRSGDWIVPRYQGEARLKKPPLQSWLQAGAMAVTGSTAVVVAGFASWWMGLLFAASPWLIGRALGRPVAGLLGSLCLASARGSTWWGGSPEHDVPFAAWTGLSWALLALHLTRRPGPGVALAAGLACGAAVLVKGPFALAFLWGTALVLPLVARRLARGEPSPIAPPASVGRVRWLPFVVGSLAPGLAWVVAVAVRLGSVGEMFAEVGNQATGGAGSHVYRGALYVLYYVGEIPKWTLPWSVPGILAIAWFALRSRRRAPEAADSAQPSLLFAWTAFAVSFVVLTVTPGKQPHYVLPLLPLACLLFGGAFERLLDSPRAARSIPWIATALGIGVALERIGSAGFVPWIPLGVPMVGIGTLWIVVPAGVWAWRGRLLRSASWGLVAAAGAAGVAGAADASRYTRTHDYAVEASVLPRSRGGGVPILGYAPPHREAFDGLAVRLDREVVRVTDPAEIDRRIEAGGAFYLLVEEPQAPLVETRTARMRRVARFSPESPRDPNDRILAFLWSGPATK